MENHNPVDDAIRKTFSGGFSSQPVPRAAVEEILALARRAPSGVNTQPWNVFVLQGEARAALVGAATGAVPGLVTDSAIQSAFWERFNRRPGTSQWPAEGPPQAGDEFLSEAMLAIPHDPVRAQADLARYFRFFDAPVGLMFTISRSLGSGSLLDYGMFLQTLTLAARARGLRSCVQTGWKGLADTVLAQLEAPDDALLVCGMALGYGDATQAPVSAPVDVPPAGSFITWHN